MNKKIKIILTVIIIFIGLVLFLATGARFVKVEESKYNISNIDGVSVSISDISLTGATIKIKDSSDISYAYGQWYVIEKEIDGKWYQLSTKIDNYGFNDIGYNTDENDEVIFVIEWEWLYGPLNLGNYRIIKEAHNKYIAIPFSIVKAS